MTIWQLNDSKNALILYYSHFAKPRWRLSIQLIKVYKFRPEELH